MDNIWERTSLKHPLVQDALKYAVRHLKDREMIWNLQKLYGLTDEEVGIIQQTAYAITEE